MKKKFHFCINKLNASAYVAKHLIGPNHTPRHQKLTGLVIMIIGVAISEACLGINMHIINSIGHVIGYGVHGIGLIPFIKDIENIN
jgi:hypothetical protein